MTDAPYLRYIGYGAFMHDVPARDLTVYEANSFGVDVLLRSGLYERFDDTPVIKPYATRKGKDKSTAETNAAEKGDE